jgi:hypothetical protein
MDAMTLRNTQNRRMMMRMRKARFGHERFFHVMNEGWYIETREGIVGPFLSHGSAREYLDTIVAELNQYQDAG